METTTWVCEFRDCHNCFEGGELPEKWSQFGHPSGRPEELSCYCPTHSSIENSISEFLSRHCTLQDDHDHLDCKKCKQMREELTILITGWVAVQTDLTATKPPPQLKEKKCRQINRREYLRVLPMRAIGMSQRTVLLSWHFPMLESVMCFASLLRFTDGMGISRQSRAATRYAIRD